jgi:hypothetical protein
MKVFKILFLLWCLIGTSINLLAQLEEKIKEQRVVQGTITRDGNVITGYIIKMGTDGILGSTGNTKYSAPWTFQKEIRFIEKSKFESLPKIRFKDFEKLEPGDIQSYSYNNDSIIFDSRKYANLSSAGLGMIPKMTFLRRVAKNKISIYAFYSSPPGNGPEEQQIADFKQSAKPELLFHKEGEDNAKTVGLMSIEKQLGECPKIVERYKKGDYNMKKEIREDIYEYYSDILQNASDQDLAKLYAIAEYNRGNCD